MVNSMPVFFVFFQVVQFNRLFCF